MHRYAVALFVCLLPSVLTDCQCDDATGTRGPGDEDATSDATVDLAFDLSVPDLLPSDAEADGGADSAQTDSDLTLRLDFDPPVADCDRWGFYGGVLNLRLSWTTTLATVCEATITLEGGLEQSIDMSEVVPAWSHVLDYSLTMFSGWSEPPQVGDLIHLTVRCEAENEMRIGAQQTFDLDREERECIWPFNDACSDDSLVMCSRALEACPEALVPAVIDGCPRCVYPATCTCDDGTELICDGVPPDCAQHEVVAIQEGCHRCVEPWSCLPSGEYTCPTYAAALADCAYQWVSPVLEDICPWTVCMDEPCQTDDDCPLADSLDTGGQCVTGNCVYCWEDAQCTRSEVCRGGRCVGYEAPSCPTTSHCEESGCRAVTPSEAPCDVCVCDSWFGLACSADSDCQVISSHYYSNCVYGRCAECQNDDDCDYGACLPPGICFDMTPHPEALYGTWIVGWGGGMNHFSYVRFEPDGTMRRGRYDEDSIWADDFPPLPCWPAGVVEYPLIGTWEPEITASGQLVIRMSLNIVCDTGDGWNARMAIAFADDLESASFDEIDSDTIWEAYRVPTDACTPEFSFCQTPDF